MSGDRSEQATGPLVGVRVVEAASYVSGPFATQAFVDLGATVVKIEPPDGEPYRRFGPQDAGGGVMFRAINRGKQSVVLDLKQPAGVEQLHRLLTDADVFLSNWRPAVAETFGLTPQTVTERWPRLVWARISGFGQDGPMAESAAFDSIIQARTGIVAALSAAEPTVAPMYLADKVTAMTATQAVLAALLERGRTGRGNVVDVSMLDALGYFNTPDLFAGHQTVGEENPAVFRQLSAPRPLATTDGAVVLSPVSGRQLKRALEAVGAAHRATELKAAPDATTMTELFYTVMAEYVADGTTAHWVAALERADVPVTAVLDMPAHLADKQVIHNCLYRVSDGACGTLQRRPRYPALFAGEPLLAGDAPAPEFPPAR